MWWPFSQSSRRDNAPRDTQRIFEKVSHFLADEKAQNDRLPDDIRREILANPSCDEVPHAFGEFGRTLINPIPVNGPIGELLYLSSLATLDRKAIAFHRLGSFETVDIFETVSEDGQCWDLLCLSMYYPRKSTRLPSGYRLIDGARRSIIRGTNLRVNDFPHGIHIATMECTKRLIGIPIRDPCLSELERRGITRPQNHVDALRQTELSGWAMVGHPLLQLFSAASQLLLKHVKGVAQDLELHLPPSFDRELTYLILYIFATLLFLTRRNAARMCADGLVAWQLRQMCRTENYDFATTLQEYRSRFAQYREASLFVTDNQSLIDEGKNTLGRHLGGAGLLFGTMVWTIVAEAVGPLTDAIRRIE